MRVVNSVDFLVIGGGVVGISIGISILEKHPSAKVVVVEKENFLGAHASGRNSGVLHAGFYYSPDSLKAKFCREGNLILRNLIKENNIPLRETGKVVVTSDEVGETQLHKLYLRGKTNGVKLELLAKDKIGKFEPLASTFKNFLWSPTTAVSSPAKVIEILAAKFEHLRGVLIVGNEGKLLDENHIDIDGSRFKANQVVNAAGVNAVHIAHKFGGGMKYDLLPVLGVYRATDNHKLPIKTLIYPVPNPKNPFLGVHFTLTVEGQTKIGPSAIPVIGRFQYKIRSSIELMDLKSTTKALYSLGKNSPKELFTIISSELPRISEKRLIKDAEILVPNISKNINWEVKPPGLRAQLVNLTNGTFEQDFVIEKSGPILHVLNAVSPGWTSSIPFAKWIVNSNY